MNGVIGELANTCTCDTEYTDDCGGFCWQQNFEMFADDVRELVKANPAGWWTITGLKLWNREVDGNFQANTVEHILRAMTVNTIWSMKYSVFDDRIEYSLSHHDAPTGSNSVLRPMP